MIQGTLHTRRSNVLIASHVATQTEVCTSDGPQQTPSSINSYQQLALLSQILLEIVDILEKGRLIMNGLTKLKSITKGAEFLTLSIISIIDFW